MRSLVNRTLDENVQPGCMPSCSCGGKSRKEERTINFDQFFEVMIKRIKDERVFSKDVVFESSMPSFLIFL